MKKTYTKQEKENALKLWMTGAPVANISKDLGIPEPTLSAWACRAGLNRKRLKKRTNRRQPGQIKRQPRRPALDGSLRVVASLITVPGLNNDQRIKMISAFIGDVG